MRWASDGFAPPPCDLSQQGGSLQILQVVSKFLCGRQSFVTGQDVYRLVSVTFAGNVTQRPRLKSVVRGTPIDVVEMDRLRIKKITIGMQPSPSCLQCIPVDQRSEHWYSPGNSLPLSPSRCSLPAAQRYEDPSNRYCPSISPPFQNQSC
jgi:hypothetical protein